MTDAGRIPDLAERLTVAICTFRRPALAAALQSLQEQDADGLPWSVLVVDNDDVPSAQATVERARSLTGLDIAYRHVPGRNIAIARNGCLDHAQGRWLVFMDDDEIAPRGWLAALVRERFQPCAAVFGPVRALYEPDQPRWMRLGDFHSFTVVRVRGRILSGYTANVLIDRTHPAVAQRQFDVALGRSGGEDSDYFSAVSAAGGQLGYAPEAVMEERVVAERANLRWLLVRRFRMGQTHGRTLRRQGRSRSGVAAMAAAKLTVCMLGALICVLSAPHWRGWLQRGALHAGVLAHMFGGADLVLYGQGAPSTARES